MYINKIKMLFLRIGAAQRREQDFITWVQFKVLII